MKKLLGVSPSKRNQGITQGEKTNSYDLVGNQTHDLRLRTRNGRSNPEVVGSIPTKVT